ncbi:hypothetical protein PSPO01_08978 [Paraphaeosphaeria sporulosa]
MFAKSILWFGRRKKGMRGRRGLYLRAHGARHAPLPLTATPSVTALCSAIGEPHSKSGLRQGWPPAQFTQGSRVAAFGGGPHGTCSNRDGWRRRRLCGSCAVRTLGGKASKRRGIAARQLVASGELAGSDTLPSRMEESSEGCSSSGLPFRRGRLRYGKWIPPITYRRLNPPVRRSTRPRLWQELLSLGMPYVPCMECTTLLYTGANVYLPSQGTQQSICSPEDRIIVYAVYK